MWDETGVQALQDPKPTRISLAPCGLQVLFWESLLLDPANGAVWLFNDPAQTQASDLELKL